VAASPWFDKLTTSGMSQPLILSLSKGILSLPALSEAEGSKGILSLSKGESRSFSLRC